MFLFLLGTNLEAIATCELCKEKLRLNIDNFDIQELYKTHVQVSHRFTSCGDLNFTIYRKQYISIEVKPAKWE